MKKITLQSLTALALFAGMSCFGQMTGSTAVSGPSLGIQNNHGTQDTRNNAVSDVLILAAEANQAWIDDVEAKIEAIGEHDVESLRVDNATPTLADLQAYDAVFVFSDFQFFDPVAFGNVLAEYLEAGGGVVDATFNANTPPTGNWSNYELYSGASNTSGQVASIGTINDPGNPILFEVNDFNGGTSSYRNINGTIASGTSIVAELSDGLPFILTKENVGPENVRRVFLNFFPPSIDVRDDFWDATTDGGQLMSNALEWVITGDVLSTDENEIANNISLFPNPAQNEITISKAGDFEIKNAQIIDVVGRVVNTFNVEGVSTTVSISNLKTGVYFLKLEGNASSQSLKFIKN